MFESVDEFSCRRCQVVSPDMQIIILMLTMKGQAF